ncbi:MAG: hypothetical protein KDB92_13255, partial [Chitinophagaceae bacterium]|nr:hypothetical protein [Chitinophagaceae bacterium]
PFNLTLNCCPTLTVDPVADQSLCAGSATSAVTFTGAEPGTVYSWTNDNTAIGLAASGTGNIASFAATNATNAPITATITVTPTHAGCPDGTSTTFMITVDPTPTVDPVANQVLCNGANTAAVNFTGPVAGTFYSWTNDQPGIGLAASGVGDIASFTATNGGGTPVVATITVTPQTGSLPPLPVTFSNTTPVAIPGTGTSGVGSPYPSNIVVSGLPTTGVAVQSVTLTNIMHTWASDVELLLVSPTGQKFVLMSDVGGSVSLDAAATLTLKDGSPALPLSSVVIPTGDYAPTSANSLSTWEAPAPSAPYNFPAPAGGSTFASVFNTSTDYNGTWKLFARDDAGGDAGAINGGWSITFVQTASNNCVGSSETFTITVNPTPNT